MKSQVAPKPESIKMNEFIKELVESLKDFLCTLERASRKSLQAYDRISIIDEKKYKNNFCDKNSVSSLK